MTRSSRHRQETPERSPGRRRFIQIGLLTGTAIAGWGLRDARASEAPPSPSPSPATPVEPLPPTILEPQRTGTLAPERADLLFAIFADIGRRWDNAAFNRVDRNEFLRVTALKTRRAPAYLTEYELATQLLTDWTARYGRARALDILFAIPADAALTTVQGHVRTFTLSELLRLQVSQGTFRKLGYVNFPGFAGGRYNNPARLPYRRA